MTTESSSDLEQLLREFRRHHDRLRSLAGPPDMQAVASSTDDLIREIDLIGEQLLVADEELRVQSEELASAHSTLTDILTAYEQLFMDAPVPYLQTDLDGVILRKNRAAGRIADASAAGSSRTLAGLFALADRPAVRDLLSHIRLSFASTALTRLPDIRPVEASLQQAGRSVPVVLSAQLMLPTAAATLVHWELRPRTAGPVAVGSAPSVTTVVSMAAALQKIASAADLASMADRIAAAGSSLVPNASGCALVLRRARDRTKIASASDARARHITDLQRSAQQGPAFDAVQTGVVVRTDSLCDDRRWPRLMARESKVCGSALAAPLIGPRGPLGALVCYSPATAAFGIEEESLAASFAGQAALLYSARELEHNLRAGMETREHIGQAVGVLMERHRLSSKQAFDLLVYVSQRTHRKLRDIALCVTETGEDPHEFLKTAPLA